MGGERTKEGQQSQQQQQQHHHPSNLIPEHDSGVLAVGFGIGVRHHSAAVPRRTLLLPQGRSGQRLGAHIPTAARGRAS